MKTIVLTTPEDFAYTLAKEGEAVEIIGRYAVKHEEIINMHVTIIHQAKNTTARISLKATADDKASIIITGTVIVGKHAQGTNSFLEERILLLSPKAAAQVVPNLEIKTNDIVCSHAATVGEIDEKQMFYLASRGIPETNAKHIISESFLK